MLKEYYRSNGELCDWIINLWFLSKIEKKKDFSDDFFANLELIKDNWDKEKFLDVEFVIDHSVRNDPSLFDFDLFNGVKNFDKTIIYDIILKEKKKKQVNKKMDCCIDPVLKQVLLDGSLPELVEFYWRRQRGCCEEGMKARRKRELLAAWECKGPIKEHLKKCENCKKKVDDILMEIWRRWKHDEWWEFGGVFFKLLILGQFDCFFLNIDEKDIKLNHLNVYFRGFLPGLVCIM